jgi:hypothetical protein
MPNYIKNWGLKKRERWNSLHEQRSIHLCLNLNPSHRQIKINTIFARLAV